MPVSLNFRGEETFLRIASIKNVTELLIVVGGRLQGLSDILRRQLVRLDTVW